jgi:hypothetical protein
MLDAAVSSGKLFFSGRLFRDTRLACRQLAIGAGIGAIVIVIAALFIPLWGAAIIGGGVSGFLQPVLFKDLKYA